MSQHRSNTTTTTYADDTAILSINDDPKVALENLQAQITKVKNGLICGAVHKSKSNKVHTRDFYSAKENVPFCFSLQYQL